MYDRIFFTNVIRILNERDMKVSELHRLSAVSVSFLSDLTKGKGNPSIKVMQQIAEALNVPLPLLLENVESQIWNDYYDKEVKRVIPELPQGFEYVGAILPSEKAFRVAKWDKETREHLKKLRSKQ